MPLRGADPGNLRDSMNTAAPMPPGVSSDEGQRMHRMVRELFPLCRSITGDGLRATLEQIGAEIPLSTTEVASGTRVFDWTIPPEWNIRDAWIRDSTGRSFAEFRNHNLHVVGYSEPVCRTMDRSELAKRIHTLPAQPHLIPYRTTYYRRGWGFCMSHNDFQSIADGPCEVRIDSTLEPGSLTFGECVLPGESPDEVLVSAHACHPSLANDNLSGIAVAVAMARHLAGRRRKLGYRFLFAPGTIGAIAWLRLHQGELSRVKHGLVLSCAGDGGALTYKRSRREGCPTDRAMEQALRESGLEHRILPFIPYGYDERQFCSPGINLPVGCLMRSPHGTFPEYHTSADTPDFVFPQKMEETLRVALAACRILEDNSTLVNLRPECEPFLGSHGLYGGSGGSRTSSFDELALLWVLNFSDGSHDLLSIAQRAGLRFEAVTEAAHALQAAGLLDKR